MGDWRYLGRRLGMKPELMHDPIGLFTFRSSTSVENKGLLHANKDGTPRLKDLLIFTRGFPVPRFSGSVSPHPCRVLPVSLAKEVPFLLSHLGFAYTSYIPKT